jgi:hypothetical protein
MEDSLKLRAEQVLKSALQSGNRSKRNIAKDILNTPELFRDFCLLITLTDKNSNKVQV